MPRSSSKCLPPFEQLINLHGESVLRFCNARAGVEHGEDCFQETMLAALRAYDQVREPDAILGWLFSIAARKAIDSHSARGRAPTPVEDLEPLMPTQDDRLRDEGTWELVRALPPKQRQAVTLRYLGDLTNQEIAGAMQTSEEAARRNVFEGLRSLRRVSQGVAITVSACATGSAPSPGAPVRRWGSFFTTPSSRPHVLPPSIV
jgi:RNA polymerase sigma factor (sigma-70 family)